MTVPELAIEDAIVSHLTNKFGSDKSVEITAMYKFLKDDVIAKAERARNLIIVSFIGDKISEGTQRRPLGERIEILISLFHKGGKDRSGLHILRQKVREGMSDFYYGISKINYIEGAVSPAPIEQGIFVAEMLYWLDVLDFPFVTPEPEPEEE